MSMDRRSLLKGLAVAGAGASVASTTATASERAAPPENAVGMLYDATRCIGCRACEVACVAHHEGRFGTAAARIHVVKVEPLGIDQPHVCRQCTRAPCLDACPVGALSKDEHTGAILVDTNPTSTSGPTKTSAPAAWPSKGLELRPKCCSNMRKYPLRPWRPRVSEGNSVRAGGGVFRELCHKTARNPVDSGHFGVAGQGRRR